MKARYLLLIVLLIWLPLAYHLLLDDELQPEAAVLVQRTIDKPTSDNYYIGVMALSEQQPQPDQILQQYLEQQPAADNFDRLKLPQLSSLNELYQHPFFCELATDTCQQTLAGQPQRLQHFLAGFAPLLKQYEALQQLDEISPVNEHAMQVNWLDVLPLQQLYALYLYHLILQQDFTSAEVKLAQWIQQQRRFLSLPASSLTTSAIMVQFNDLYLPLAIALRASSNARLTILASSLAPLSINELTLVSTAQHELFVSWQLAQIADLQQLENSVPHLMYRLLYKPNLTLNLLYQHSQIAQLQQISSKTQWYHYASARQQLLDTTDYQPSTLTTRLKQSYRNFYGAILVDILSAVPDRQLIDRSQLDLSLYLLQPLLLHDVKTQAQLQQSDFALNPYTQTTVRSHNNRWCYNLTDFICLTDTNVSVLRTGTDQTGVNMQ